MKFLRALRTVLIVVGGLLFSWLILLKLIARLAARLGKSVPPSAALDWLVNSPIRRWYARPVLRRVGIHPGEHVLELGSGPGAFTVDAAERVGPGGHLAVVDAQPRMIARVEKRVLEAGVSNVETHIADAYHLPLDDESVDRVFLVTAFPELADPLRALEEINLVLKPGGLLSITEDFIDPHYTFPFETVQLVELAGFSREQYFGNFWLYTLNFCKSEGIAYD
jgi:arsenite methyltransferase